MRYGRRGDSCADTTRARRIGRIAAAVAIVVAPFALVSADGVVWPPPRLQDTGLYANFAAKTVRSDNLPYSPQYPLWTDGAEKSRWLHLPRGARIDASDSDGWKFPIGTRVWKEFRFNGRRAETRLIERATTGWRFASYQWNEAETEAVLVPEAGAQSIEIATGIRHAIPARADCRACHEASARRLLGITALQLSPDRDPNAPHAEPVPPGGLDLRSLAARELVRGLPRELLDSPPRIEAPSETARAALGYLNVNCGICHTSDGELASLQFSLRYTLHRQPHDEVPAVLTTVGRPSRFRGTGAVDRVMAGNPEGSALLLRMASRNPIAQMPPLGTRLVDEDAVRLIRKWIKEDLARSASSISKEEEKR